MTTFARPQSLNDQVLPGGGGAASSGSDPAAAMLGLKLLAAPYGGGSALAVLNAGVLVLVLVRSLAAQSITRLGIHVQAAANTPTGVNGLALYTEPGVLVDQTSSMDTQFQATGWQDAALGASQAIAANTNYYLAALTHFGSAPQVAAFLSVSVDDHPVNGHYISVFNTGVASFPASLTPSALSINSGLYVMGAQ
jgi:hypothetical protein